MDRGTAKAVKVIGLVILGLTLIMVMSVAVMLAAGAKFVPIMTAPVFFLGAGIAVCKAGSKSARKG
ncbi:hypothetical protein ACIQNG_26280 [Streptomyces sp. NPDC091377]|uniref:hypothetical protein n=1 Tax=Streptomyces sp. NPDC091377 TaxID=3365995 RepID=UPI003805C346